MRTALVSAAAGIGDILRTTPLIRVAHELGYAVDVLLSPDDPAAAGLLDGAQEIRRLLTCPDVLKNPGMGSIPELRGERYHLATSTIWSAPLMKHVSAHQFYTFDSNWKVDGDVRNVERIARAIGWEGPLPGPFAMKSSRRFDVPSHTIALHPGCKSNWPWKKWHGFDELAGFFESVAIVGTRADLDNRGTYFVRPYKWPAHAYDFVGKLDLRDTAALLSQCAAVVSPDSGLMHLGVALRRPTFGIFGITSPARECVPSPHMTAITKHLPCEGACHRASWGRRDCTYRLQCLKTLTARDVAIQIAAVFGGGVRGIGGRSE